MADVVYPPVIAALRALFRALDLKIRVEGAEHVPRTGGAVLASNHVSYLDFIFAGLGARPSGRLTRFMAKQEIFAHPIGGPLMRGMHHLPVDRSAGIASYKAALAALKAGEVVGIFPEATISESFTVKDIKDGAARLAAGAGVPLIPVALWGTQRLWTKGRPRTLTRRHTPITILVGEPSHPPPPPRRPPPIPTLVGEPMPPPRRDNKDELSAALRARMQSLLDRAQQEYPDKPDGTDDSWWLPAHLGGTAPAPSDVDSRP